MRTIQFVKSMRKIIALFVLLFIIYNDNNGQLPPFNTTIGTRFKYMMHAVTAKGAEEFPQKIVVTDFPEYYGAGRVEFYYDIEAMIPKEGKVVMKPKATTKGRWDERKLKGGDLTFSKQTAFWLSTRQMESLLSGGSFNWGKHGNIRYVLKNHDFYSLKFNDTTQTYPVLKVIWEQNSKYKMTILNNPENPLIMAVEFYDENTNYCRFFLTDVTQLEGEYLKFEKGQKNLLIQEIETPKPEKEKKKTKKNKK